MKKLTTEETYQKALLDVNTLMKKGENNLTPKDAAKISALANAVQNYEKMHYPFPMPKTINEMIELKMFEKKINRVKLSKMLGIAPPKLTQILNKKREPDVHFLKAIHEKLGVDGNFILEKV